MSKLPQNSIRYYTENDIYEFSVDNRPLIDLAGNLDIVNSSIDSFGFYKELPANPETEPPQGFTLFTCAYIGPNSRLYPINIYDSVFLVDYSKVEIVLITGKTSVGNYTCLTFASDIQISRSPSFSASSVGLTAKIGQAGIILDELSFERLYATGTFQNVTIGKILNSTSISFGGNQVTTVGNNRFLSKNTDDASSGNITWNRNNLNSSTFFAGTLENGFSSPYPHGEINISNITGFNRQLPIYFVNKTLNSDQMTGLFTDTDFFTRLNEVHFATPSINVSSGQDLKYFSSGVNVNSLLTFSDSFLLKNVSWSSTSGDVLSQSIGTPLKFIQTGSNNLFISMGGSVDGKSSVIDTNVVSIGGKSNVSGIPEHLFVPLQSQIRGLVFDGFETTTNSGAFFGVIQNNISSTEIPLPEDAKFISYSEMIGGKSLVLYHKNSSSQSKGAANLFICSDGYTVLSARGGVHYQPDPVLSTELVNLGFLLKTLSSSSTNSLSVQGNDLNNPILNSLTFDVSASSEPNIILKMSAFSESRFISNVPIEFRATQTTYQTVRGTIPNDTSAQASNNDLTTRGYVHYFVSQALTGGSQGLFITLNTDQSIVGQKTFNKPAIFNSDITRDPATSIILFASNTSQILKLGVNIPVVGFEYATNTYSKILTSETLDTDITTTTTSKGYVDSKNTAQTVIINQLGTRVTTLEGSALVLNSLAQNQLLGYGYWRNSSSNSSLNNGSFTSQSTNLVNFLTRVVGGGGLAFFKASRPCAIEYSATITVNPTASFDTTVMLKLGTGNILTDLTIAEVQVSGSGVNHETVTISALDYLDTNQCVYLVYNTVSSTPPNYASSGFIKVIGSTNV